MASRQSRSERRARRQDGGVAAAAPPLMPPRPRPVASGGEDQPRRMPGGGLRQFVGESWAELKKVEWPGQKQLVQGTVAVLVACVIVGVFLYVSDIVFKRLVEDVFLK